MADGDGEGDGGGKRQLSFKLHTDTIPRFFYLPKSYPKGPCSIPLMRSPVKTKKVNIVRFLLEAELMMFIAWSHW